MRFLKNLVFPFAFLFCFSGLAQIPKALFDFQQQEFKSDLFVASIGAYKSKNIDSNKYISDFYGYRRQNFFKDFDLSQKYYFSKDFLQIESDLNLNLMHGTLLHDTYWNPANFYNEIHSPLVSARLKARRYYPEKKYLEVGILVNHLFVDFQYKTKNGMASYYKDSALPVYSIAHNLNVFVPIRIGIGRINQVQHLLHSKALVDEVLRVENDTPELHPADAVELTELLVDLNKNRFQNYQLKRVKEIQLLDSFLTDRNYIQGTPTSVYPASKGSRSFEKGIVRNQGRRFSIGYTGGWDFVHFVSEEELNTFPKEAYRMQSKMNNFIFSIGLDYRNEKPLGANWQYSFSLFSNLDNYFNMGVQPAYNAQADRDICWMCILHEYPFKYERFHILQLGLNQNFTYYAFSNFDFSLGYTIKQAFFDTDQFNRLGYISLDFMANYYISRALHLNVAASLNNLASSSYYYDVSVNNLMFVNPSEHYFKDIPGVFMLPDNRIAGPDWSFYSLKASLLYRIF